MQVTSCLFQALTGRIRAPLAQMFSDLSYEYSNGRIWGRSLIGISIGFEGSFLNSLVLIIDETCLRSWFLRGVVESARSVFG